MSRNNSIYTGKEHKLWGQSGIVCYDREQTIIQAALYSIETFDGTKSKFEDWAESIENAAQISGQDTLHIALSKMTGYPLSSTNRLNAWSPNLMWTELKRELPMQYSAIPFKNPAT